MRIIVDMKHAFDTQSLVRRRVEKGMTQTELARRVGVVPATIYFTENGLSKNPKTVSKMAKILGLRMEDITIISEKSA